MMTHGDCENVLCLTEEKKPSEEYDQSSKLATSFACSAATM